MFYVGLNSVEYQYYLSRSMGNLSNSSSDHSGHNATPSQQVSPIARELGAILKVTTPSQCH